ncbi:MAG TPA: aminopeptidase P family protein [Ghiorsea sp.]|nr:aminopeptidase P family protein [Ghiorsea sp.]HIP06272.1 aminopeptidase P family protein [Mariprofundaceae bacterium]
MSTAKLLISGSEHFADMLYVSGLFVPDAFIVVGLEHENNIAWHGLLSPLEVDRAKVQSKLDEVHLDTVWHDKAKNNGWQRSLSTAAAAFLQAHGVKNVTVPADFPFLYARELITLGFEVSPSPASLFPERVIKSEDEIIRLTHAEKLTAQSMLKAETFIAACGINNDGLVIFPSEHERAGEVVTSEAIRAVIETFLIGQGAVPSHTIVACGSQSADPHDMGSGNISAHQPIIIDIFPRLVASGYWGDMTRTYVKGKASETLNHMYQTVFEGQSMGLDMVQAGVDTANIHNSITAHFDKQGFKTGIANGKQGGFFHGTGHGVGLDIHENPRVSSNGAILEQRMVITIEPGLYYADIGGVRLEDLVVVRENGCDNLTNFHRTLELE